MQRIVLFALAGAVAGLTGCSSSARFVDRQPSGGVVAVPDAKHRGDGLALIKKQVGRDFEIADEREVTTGTITKSVAETGRGSVFARSASWFTGREKTQTNVTTTGNQTEWRITYVKPSALPATGTIEKTSVVSAPDAAAVTTVQTQYLSAAAVPPANPAPGLLPPVLPAAPPGR